MHLLADQTRILRAEVAKTTAAEVHNAPAVVVTLRSPAIKTPKSVTGAEFMRIVPKLAPPHELQNSVRS